MLAAPSRQAARGGAPMQAIRGTARLSGVGLLSGRRRCVRVSAGVEPGKIVAAASDQLFDLAVRHANLLHTVAEADATKPANDEGPFGFLTDGFEAFLKILDSGLEKAGVPYSYGFAIILLTIIVKVATFPLTQKQVQSTTSMQALQPYVKELQAKYAGQTEQLQVETARLYREAGVNPLAGCLPTLATIPIFIGLYRALTKAADDGLLDNQGFFWIPSLAGPTSLATREAGGGLSWLFPLQNGAPPIGWHDAGLYLVLPILLIVSQWYSQKMMQPAGAANDPAQQSTQAILKFLPLMIGWFSLNVPSGLTLYWFVNNILSTGQTLYLRSVTKVNLPGLSVSAPSGSGGKPGSGGGGAAVAARPKEEERVKGPTGKDLGARRKKSDGSGSDSEVVDVTIVSSSSGSGSSGGFSGADRGGAGGGKKDRGAKFRARKAREVASQASSLAAGGSAAAEAAQKPPSPPAGPADGNGPSGAAPSAPSGQQGSDQPPAGGQQ